MEHEEALAAMRQEESLGVLMWISPAATETMAVSEAPVQARVYVVSDRGVTSFVPGVLAETAPTPLSMLHEDVSEESYLRVEDWL